MSCFFHCDIFYWFNGAKIRNKNEKRKKRGDHFFHFVKITLWLVVVDEEGPVHLGGHQGVDIVVVFLGDGFLGQGGVTADEASQVLQE